MNIPFVTNRGNMGDRLGFLHPRDVSGPAAAAPGSRAHWHGHRPDDNDDRTPLSPLSPLSTSSYTSSAHSSTTDLEAQHPPEMTERPAAAASRFLPRFRLSLFSVASTSRPPPRPSSSHYSGDGLPPATVVNAPAAGNGNSVLSTPKTPEFRIGVQDLPSTRLHLPNLTRTWTQGSNGPPSRPGTGRRDDGGGVAEPAAAVVRERGERRRRHRHRREGSGSGSGSGSGRRSRRRAAAATAEGEEAPQEERRRRRRRRRDHPEAAMGNTATATSSSSSSGSRSGSQRGPPPKNFLFCFPWIKSRRIRRQILRCFISGMFLVLILTIYLSLSITKNINSSEFTVLLILVILFVTLFFCHALVRLCMLIMRNKTSPVDDPANSSSRRRLPDMMGPGGYAIPRRPIRVVLARDEEAAGIESEATKTNPPAYGIWRESVRVDPDRIYWMRNEAEMVEEGRESREGSASPPASRSRRTSDDDDDVRRPRTTAPRPPSYASDDGVSYVVEAQPRSIAPVGDVPLRMSMHPAEAGRAGLPPAW
ncbi:hypothetical protein QBC39DRAFT_405755 [Podospora conica]|nr:hypothetical protein QBC39DRAFT_405755 [Schizothecium conicum]